MVRRPLVYELFNYSHCRTLHECACSFQQRRLDDYRLFMAIFGIPVEFQYYAGGEAPETRPPSGYLISCSPQRLPINGLTNLDEESCMGVVAVLMSVCPKLKHNWNNGNAACSNVCYKTPVLTFTIVQKIEYVGIVERRERICFQYYNIIFIYFQLCSANRCNRPQFQIVEGLVCN